MNLWPYKLVSLLLAPIRKINSPLKIRL